MTMDVTTSQHYPPTFNVIINPGGLVNSPGTVDTISGVVHVVSNAANDDTLTVTIFPYIVADDVDNDGIPDHLDPDIPCCVVATGNVDCDSGETTDISDLTILIDHLFINNTPLCCAEEANTDGGLDGVVDIGDLTILIDHLFINNNPLPGCL